MSKNQSRKSRRYANCMAWPVVTNVKTGEKEPSKLYQEMLKRLNNRPLVNMLYATYSMKETKEMFDRKGHKRNQQGEHSYKALRLEMHLDKNLREMIPNDAEMKAEGFMQQNGEYTVFDSGVEAVDRSYEYNNTHEFKVSVVRRVGDKYTVEIMDKTSQTLQNEVLVEDWHTTWHTFKEELEKAGIDADELAKINPAMINPFTVNEFLERINLIKRTPQNLLDVQNVEILLNLAKHSSVVQQALSRYSGETLHQIAEKLVSAFADRSSVPDGEYSFLQNIVNTAKTNIGINVDEVVRSIGFSNDVNRFGSEAYNTMQRLTELNAEYGIDNNVITRTTREIKSLSDAAVDIMFNLKRQIENVRKEINSTNTEQQQKRLDELYSMLDTLQEELNNKNYYVGLTVTLTKVAQYQNIISKALEEAKQISTGDIVGDSIAKADILAKARNLFDAYYSIVKKLSNLDSVIVDEQLSTEEKKGIEDLARRITDSFEKQNTLFNESVKTVCGDVAMHYLGYSTETGGTVAELLDGMEDAGLTDFLYSCARSSNKMIAVVGSVIREAQRERDRKLSDIQLRIDRANDKLFKNSKKKSSAFMYEKVYDDNGNFLYETVTGKIDWAKFEDQRAAWYASCKSEGMTKYQLMDAMRQWEAENTYMSDEFGKLMPIPIEMYWKESDFQEGWDDAQKEYYKEMMQIKCELHELMPEYVKNVFLAPQIRKSWQQEIEEALAKQITPSQFFRSTLDRLKFWKIKDDDVRYSKNGQRLGNKVIIDGKECVILNSTFNNNIIKNIPLFYVKELTDKAELTHDFSQAVMKLATTALNYDAMSKIQNLVEMMSDYIKDIKKVSKKGNNKAVDIINTGEQVLARQLVDYSEQTNTAKILEAYVTSQLYGRAEDPSKWSVWINTILDMTRLKALSINVKGFIANELMGEAQNIIEAMGGEFFNVGDYAKASVQLFSKLNIMDGLTNNVNSMAGLLERRFNPIQENYRNASEKRYYKTACGKIFGSISAFEGYQVGEYMIHMKNMYAILNHTKVMQNGKMVSLMKVLKKSQKLDGNSELYVDDGVTTLDGRVITDMNDPFFDELQRRIEYVNQTCHGAMNVEDKGVINQRDIGRLATTFRQWMVEHYSRRYRKMHYDNSGSDPIMQNFYFDNKVMIDGKKKPLYDAFDRIKTADGGFKLVLKDDVEIKDKNGITVDESYVESLFNAYLNSIGYREGFMQTMFDFCGSVASGLKQQFDKASVTESWDNLTENQKYNVRRFLGAVAMFAMCLAQVRLVPAPRKKNDPDYDDDDFIQSYAYKLWYYEIKRMMMEENASAPWGVITEGNKMINQLIPAQSTVYGLFYPILGLIRGDAGETMKQGKHKGENKYWKNLKTYTFPFTYIGQYENIRDFAEDPDIYKIFERQYKAY